MWPDSQKGTGVLHTHPISQLWSDFCLTYSSEIYKIFLSLCLQERNFQLHSLPTNEGIKVVKLVSYIYKTCFLKSSHFYTINVERFAGLNFRIFVVFKSTVKMFPWIFIYIYKLKYFKCKTLQKFFHENFIHQSLAQKIFPHLWQVNLMQN